MESGYPTRCVGCGASSYQLHHLTYDRLGHEELRDLLSLCSSCHEGIHGKNFEGVPLVDPEAGLALLFHWSDRETTAHFAEIRECWRTLPRGKPEVRARLFPRRDMGERVEHPRVVRARAQRPGREGPEEVLARMRRIIPLEDRYGRVFVQCSACGKRGWQDEIVCTLCKADCELLADWR